MIDINRINELTAEIGAEDLRLILELFLEEAVQTLDRLEDGLPPHELGRAMHFLRSGALNTGLRGVAITAAAIEAEGTDVAAAALRLRETLGRTRADLDALDALAA